MRRVRLFLLAAIFFLASPLIAQTDTASLEGRVVDSSGALITSASVSVVNLQTNFTYHAVSDSAGQWAISPIRIGSYRVTIEAVGFKKVVTGSITLDVQQRQRVDVTLLPGEVTQQVEVQGSSPLIQTDTSESGQVIDSETMVGMPLNGRNAVQLAQLTVGVNANEPGGRTTSTFGFSADGSRSIDNNFLLDGIDNNSNLPDLLNGANYVIMPPPDALQEFKIETDNYDAEFGRSTGAIVNAVTRSGSNDFHGALYEFLRNQKLDAMNYYDAKLQPYHQNQFGVAVGGRVLRNKLFFFADYEGLRISQAQPNTALVPTTAQRSGDFSSQLNLAAPTGVADCNGKPTYSGELFDTTLTKASSATPSGYCGVPFGYGIDGNPSNVIPAGKIDQLGQTLIQLFPQANVTASGYNFLSDPLLTENANQEDYRVDQVFSTHDTAFYRFSMSRSPSIIPSPFPGVADGGGFFTGVQQLNAYSAAISEAHIISAAKVNEIRIGYNRQYTFRYQENYTQNESGSLGFPGVPYATGNGGLPQLTFSDASTLGSPTYLPAIERQNTYVVADTFTLIAGKQTWKFGGEIRPEEFTMSEPPSARGNMGFGPQFTDNAGDPGSGGSGLATLLTGQPGSGGIDSIETGDYGRHTYSGFVQDDWRLTPRLSLNLGLRYEYYSPTTESSNAQANFNYYTGNLDIPKDSNGALTPYLATIIPVNHNASDGLIAPYYKDVSPRVGFAYQVSPRLTAQSAFGIFYSNDEPGIFGYAGENTPFMSSESYVVPCSLPSNNAAAQNCSIPGLSVLSQGFPSGALSNPNTPNLTGWEPNMRTPYVMQWHLTIQYELGKSSVFETAFVGSKGNREYVEPNANQAAPTANPAAPYAPRRPFPYINAPIYAVEAEGDSNYNGLQASLKHRLSAGLSATVNYTYSKALGDGSTTMGSQNNDAFRWSAEPGIEYGPLDFDIRQRFVASFLYQMPFGRGQALGGNSSKLVDGLIGNWDLTGIVSLSTGNWFTVTDADGNFANSDGQQRPNFVPGQKANGKPCVPGTFFNTCAFADPPLGSFGNVSLNSLEGPGYKDADFAIQKVVPVHDKMKLELRGEMFNAWNHPNFLFAAPGPQNSNSATVLGTPSFGYVTAAQSPREIQVGAKFTY
jgi:outer membrane receptor protein involved in Fe transport